MARDIIIHYDETAGKIVCSTVESSHTAPLLAGALPLETPVASFKSKLADEAERMLGAALFALLDLSANPKIGIRDYKAATTHWEEEHSKDLQQRVALNEPEALFELAMSSVTEGLRTKSKKTMEDADALLHRASDAGSAEAAEYLINLWPVLKKRFDG